MWGKVSTSAESFVSECFDCNVCLSILYLFGFLFLKKFIHELIYQTLDNKHKLRKIQLNQSAFF